MNRAPPSCRQLRESPIFSPRGTSSLPEKCRAKHLSRLAFIAKRLECVRLAGAFEVEVCPPPRKAGASSSKLRALQTLRDSRSLSWQNAAPESLTADDADFSYPRNLRNPRSKSAFCTCTRSLRKAQPFAIETSKLQLELQTLRISALRPSGFGFPAAAVTSPTAPSRPPRVGRGLYSRIDQSQAPLFAQSSDRTGARFRSGHRQNSA